MSQPLEVIVVIEGGAVQDVSVPPGVRVVIRDYDVEGYDPDDPRLVPSGSELDQLPQAERSPTP